ncbi:Histidine triad (HIT) protein [Kalmanozyma brasiliensis GHG001]|uniref:Aprataxin C2HE/C2H2/C2HC zinc finger domain-containing protein n=1 Tax=Kalmanozyma brasiliensis (strain GHG001) TaxID=1365824 RepID=V5GHS0_KALBG|nr:Histidine triad (HIT) protein [Kalmanozyma brasiliensis GHG001]EST05522.1 Histidine triad (HIT) protein [Kalmanozyma brasiliensis GHG001]
MAPQWDKALVKIARSHDPEALPLDDRMLIYDKRTITIYDKFAKAKYHFLVLPRIPFHASSSKPALSSQGAPTLSASNGKLNFGATSSNSVPASHMKSISTLLASPYAAEVLEALREASDRVIEHITKDMQEQYGTTWDIERAFHAVPSMEHLHLHVVSMDLVSDRLKHKKHFRSFHPTVGFALRLDDVEAMVKAGRRTLPKSEAAYEQLLKGPLMSHHTGQTFKFFPELKAHLEAYWRNSILAPSRTSAGDAAITTSLKRDAVEQESGASASPSDQPPSQLRRLDTPKASVKEASDSEDDEPSLPFR